MSVCHRKLSMAESLSNRDELVVEIKGWVGCGVADSVKRKPFD
jgi:hypothetical protein